MSDAGFDPSTVGISDIAVYAPPASLRLEQLVEQYEKGSRTARLLKKAAETTGQEAFRFPQIWEDTVTMEAQAALDLIERSKDLDLSGLRYLAAGTETTVDHSKPVAAYMEGMLQGAGVPIPRTLSTYQIQHACAGGTISLLAVGALLSLRGSRRESGIVVCSDVARYDRKSTAEVTQGAGAVALLVRLDPNLVELDVRTQGYFSSDVDDFFRPLGSETARVKGGYSMQCYHESLQEAFLDHCRNRGQTPQEVLRSTDLFVLHAPFRNMPGIAMKHLLARHLDLAEPEAERFLADRGLPQSVEPVARIGNIYSGSVYLALAALLADRYREWGERIVGKRLLLASYGSGNTMVVLSGRVASRAPHVIEAWDADALWAKEKQATAEQYRRFTEGPYRGERYGELFDQERDGVPQGCFYLQGIRQDGYREYSRK